MIQQTIFLFKLGLTRKKLTARGGLALMAEFNHGIGIKELADKYLPGHGSNRGFKPSVFVDSLVLMLQGGGRSFEDIRELKYEEGLMNLIDIDKVPDPDSVGDWCRRMGNLTTGQKGLKGLGKLRDRLNHRMMKRDKTKIYTLDADAMGIIAEKADAFYTYKGEKGYMPMAGFLFELKLCIYDEFREGNTVPAFGQKEFYRECKARMPKGKEIGYYRADSASYQADLINDLEEDGVKWGITADLDHAVKTLIAGIPDNEWYKAEKDCGYEIAEAIHTMNQTKKAFRLVIKRELRREANLFQQEKYFHHAIATNWDEQEKNAVEVLQWHNQRGEAENFNKD
jgi:hypothetical protein